MLPSLVLLPSLAVYACSPRCETRKEKETPYVPKPVKVKDLTSQAAGTELCLSQSIFIVHWQLQSSEQKATYLQERQALFLCITVKTVICTLPLLRMRKSC